MGGGGFKDFTAIGDVTNTAARFQESARGGDVVMCAATYEAVAGEYPAAEPGLLDLKGKRSMVQSFRISFE